MKKISVLIVSLLFLILFVPAVWAVTVGGDKIFYVDQGSSGLQVLDFGVEYPNDEFAWGTLTLTSQTNNEINFSWSGFYHKMHPDGDPLHEGGPGVEFSISSSRIDLIGFNFPSGWTIPTTEEFSFTPSNPQGHGPHYDWAPPLKVTHGRISLPGVQQETFVFVISGIVHTYDNNNPLVPEPATIISGLFGLVGFALRKFRG